MFVPDYMIHCASVCISDTEAIVAGTSFAGVLCKPLSACITSRSCCAYSQTLELFFILFLYAGAAVLIHSFRCHCGNTAFERTSLKVLALQFQLFVHLCFSVV